MASGGWNAGEPENSAGFQPKANSFLVDTQGWGTLSLSKRAGASFDRLRTLAVGVNENGTRSKAAHTESFV